MPSLQTLAQQLVELRAQITAIEEQAKPLKAQKDELQAQVLEMMKATEQYGVKFQDFTVSRAVRKTLAVTNEKAVIEQLKERGMSQYYSEQLNDLFKGSLAKEIVKAGEAIDGTEIAESEYISVRKAKATERRNVTTEPFQSKLPHVVSRRADSS